MATITLLKLKKKRTESFEIHLDGKCWREILPEVVLRFQLKEGLHLDNGRLDEIIGEDEFVRGRNIAARWLALKPRSVGEVRTRLKKGHLSPHSIKRVISYFREKNVLNDEAFGRLFVKNQVKMGRKTPAQIIMALMKKGFSQQTAEHFVIELFPLDAQIPLAIKRARTQVALLKKKDTYGRLRKIRSDLFKHRFHEQAVEEAVSHLDGVT